MSRPAPLHDPSASPLPDLVSAWIAAIRRGDFARAWEVADRAVARRAAEGPRPDLPRHAQAIWDGRPMAGRRVLVRCYHGLGDTLQFARFLPRVARLARELTVWAQAALIPLLATVPDIGRLLPLHEGAPGVEHEVDLEIMELAHALRVRPHELADGLPFLGVRPAERLSDRFSVGVVAQAGGWEPQRSVPIELLAPLAQIEGVALFNLQPGGAIPGATDVSAEDVLTTAARVRALDLVVTVDTMMAHLAGSLGVPTWILLRRAADWRWMEGRSDSPWYPTMRLFRQPRPGNWETVVRQVGAELERTVAR